MIDVDLTLAAPLAVLALVDSSSFGTLLIPVWLLLEPGRVRVGRLLLYLGVVAGFYLVVGLIALQAADGILELAESVASTTWVVWLQLAAGVVLFWLSFWMDTKERRARLGERLSRWRARAVDGEAGPSAVVRLALGATAVEVATMLPYIGAIGLLSAAGLSWAVATGALAVYCLIMIAPALALLVVRLGAARFVARRLSRLDAWMVRQTGTTTAWIVGIVGLLVGLDAIGRLV